MRTVPAAITTARQSPSSRLCKIWRIERADGVILRFTEHDRDLTVEGETFLATASFDPSSIKVNADLSVSDMDVQGAFDSSYITAEDLLAGRYDGATFWVAECLWDNVAVGKDVLKFGWIGRIKESGGKFVAELLDPSSRLQHNIVSAYSPSCRATLGDARCGVDLDLYTETAEVGSVTSRKRFTSNVALAPTVQTNLPDGISFGSFWKAGKVTFTTGANAGLSMDVYDVYGDEIDLMLSMPFDIEVGDAFTITAGCDKSLEMCRYRFNNVLNFRGEPHAPVTDDMIKGPVRDGISTAPASGGAGTDPVVPPPVEEPEGIVLSGSPTISDS